MWGDPVDANDVTFVDGESTALGGAWERKLVFTSNRRYRIRLPSQKLSNTSVYYVGKLMNQQIRRRFEMQNDRSGGSKIAGQKLLQCEMAGKEGNQIFERICILFKCVLQSGYRYQYSNVGTQGATLLWKSREE
jgi:hypothetical protein